ncbi:MAG: hypothetical protein MZV70_51695 [Desulfobacterales bacterium]|nr:hypothetical protein [Desulfobacterales bacterium]
MIGDHLQDHLNHGVVAVRDGGGRAAMPCGARGVTPGPCVCAPPAGPGTGKAATAGSSGGRRQRVSAWRRPIRQDGEPGDHLKIVNSGLNSLTEYGKQTAPQFDLAGDVAPP